MSVRNLAEIGAKMNFAAMGISDSLNMFGAMDFSVEVAKQGVQPILGCDLVVLVNLKNDTNGYDGNLRSSDIQTPNSSTELSEVRLTLFAKTHAGYMNLVKLVSNSYLNSQSDDANDVGGNGYDGIDMRQNDGAYDDAEDEISNDGGSASTSISENAHKRAHKSAHRNAYKRVYLSEIVKNSFDLICLFDFCNYDKAGLKDKHIAAINILKSTFGKTNDFFMEIARGRINKEAKNVDSSKNSEAGDLSRNTSGDISPAGDGLGNGKDHSLGNGAGETTGQGTGNVSTDVPEKVFEKNWSINSSHYEREILKFCFDNKIPPVAVNHAYFDSPDKFLSYKVLRCIDEGDYIASFDADKSASETPQIRVSESNYLHSEEEMLKMFSDIPEALANTVHIARKCKYFLTKQKVEFPEFSCRISEKDDLIIMSMKGLMDRFYQDDEAQEDGADKGLDGVEKNIEKNIEKDAEKDGTAFSKKENDSNIESNIKSNTTSRIDLNDAFEMNRVKLESLLRKHVPTQYVDQLFFELDVINNVGFSGYFLIVADFIRWAKLNNIPVGPGRGSGAGSVVSWSMGITEIDPMKFGLVFERFLNPDRISLPDFDIDFCQERRNEVIDYVKRRYGSKRVAHIITFGKLQAKAVLRDVGRVLQMPYSQVDKIASFIPFSAVQAVTLPEAIAKEKKLQEMANSDSQVKELFDIALELEGVFRHVSMHAAGVVISKRDLMRMVPLYKEEDSQDVMTQFHMYGVEAAGLIKFDFLGLKTLSVIQKAIEMIEKFHGIKLDINKIPLNDKNTFDMLSKKLTLGVFQLESGGMTDVLQQMNVDSFEQIIALVSLYRPGPMENIPHYVACKNGKAQPEYAYECLEPILKETYGIPVYQEQVMQIARVLCGYSLAQADLLRRAMGKKLIEEMKKHEVSFVEETCKLHGGTRKKAKALFDQIAKFSGYAFNKAHATSYAMISYQTAYLKANYAIEFITAFMIFEMHNSDKLVLIVQEARKLGIKVLKPNINKSKVKFSIENGAIRYALGGIKGLGENVLEIIVKERETNGDFNSIYDMIARIPANTLNKRQMEHLIAAGVFDDLHDNRKELYENVKNINSSLASSEISLFGQPIINKVKNDWTTEEKMEKEFEVFGFYIDEHPIESYSDYINSIGASNLSKLHQDIEDKKSILIAATVNKITKKMNKNREKYAFIKISDNYGLCELTIFPKELQKCENTLFEGANYLFTISGKEQNETIRLICNDLIDLRTAYLKSIENMNLFVKNKEDLRVVVTTLKKQIQNQMQNQGEHSGNVRVYINIISKKFTLKLMVKQLISLSSDFYNELKQFCGKDE